MGKKTVRLGVGTSDCPQSTLWSFTVSGSDVYIAQRFSYFLQKFSLHSSGRWRFASNSDKWTKHGDRALLKWLRPVPVFGSWVLGPTIVIPPLWVVDPLTVPDRYNNKIYWLLPPGKDQERIILVLFSKNEKKIDRFLETYKFNVDWIASLPIKDDGKLNSDTVWIISWLDKIRDFTKSQIKDILSGVKIHYQKGGKTTGIFGVATPIYPGNAEDVARGLSPTVIEIILGRNNLQEDNL